MEGIGQVCCKVASLRQRGPHWALSRTGESTLHGSHVWSIVQSTLVTTVLGMAFKCLSLSAPPYLTSLQSPHGFLSSRLN